MLPSIPKHVASSRKLARNRYSGSASLPLMLGKILGINLFFFFFTETAKKNKSLFTQLHLVRPLKSAN